jgi:hypothetical protein
MFSSIKNCRLTELRAATLVIASIFSLLSVSSPSCCRSHCYVLLCVLCQTWCLPLL